MSNLENFISSFHFDLFKQKKFNREKYFSSTALKKEPKKKDLLKDLERLHVALMLEMVKPGNTSQTLEELKIKIENLKVILNSEP